jgi:excisionase family DNA binding protein
VKSASGEPWHLRSVLQALPRAASPTIGSVQPDSTLAGSTDSSQEAPAAGYTLQEAAVILGISVNTLRRKLDAGRIRGERVERPQGYVWRVYLPAAAGRRNGHHPPAQQLDQEAPQPAASTLQEPPAGAALAQAELMGNLVAPLIQQAITPLVEELAATRAQLVSQAERIGRLETELKARGQDLGALRLERDQLADELRAVRVPRESDPSPDALRGPTDASVAEVAQQLSERKRPWWRWW